MQSIGPTHDSVCPIGYAGQYVYIRLYAYNVYN